MAARTRVPPSPHAISEAGSGPQNGSTQYDPSPQRVGLFPTLVGYCRKKNAAFIAPSQHLHPTALTLHYARASFVHPRNLQCLPICHLTPIPPRLHCRVCVCVCVSESSSRAQACVFAKPATKQMLVSHCAVHREAVHGRPPCQQATVPPCHQGAASLSYIGTALCEMDTFLRGVCISASPLLQHAATTERVCVCRDRSCPGAGARVVWAPLLGVGFMWKRKCHEHTIQHRIKNRFDADATEGLPEQTQSCNVLRLLTISGHTLRKYSDAFDFLVR